MKSEPPQVGCHEDTILVIGYGNDLRGDDAVGPRVAAAVAEWKLPGVRALAVHQLTPELAEAISHARTILFVDAVIAPEIQEATLIALAPSPHAEVTPHASDPRALLALAWALYGACPPAWLIQLPAISFAFGAPLSPVAEHGIATALVKIRELVNAP